MNLRQDNDDSALCVFSARLMIRFDRGAINDNQLNRSHSAFR